LVLGPHRTRPVGDRFLGTTADRVSRSAAAPCLVVRGELRLPLHRVLVPFDLSEPARGALDAALGWLDAFGARDSASGLPDVQLDVVHVIPRLLEPEGLPGGRATVGPRLQRDVEAALARAELGFAVAVREELVWGDEPAEEIVRYAREMGEGLLVMSTHGHGAVARALVGSVASGVARSAGCPVLLVPPALAGAEDAADAGRELAGQGTGA
ncbi:MAG TPA: universal stress protein, partial [Longimicrobiaceae bacterium]